MRLKTDSITHLVKIVAGEVFDEKMKQLFPQVIHSNERLRNGIKESLTRAGDPWSSMEDDSLIQEINTALMQVAKNHCRTIGAIRSRISQKEII